MPGLVKIWSRLASKGAFFLNAVLHHECVRLPLDRIHCRCCRLGFLCQLFLSNLLLLERHMLVMKLGSMAAGTAYNKASPPFPHHCNSSCLSLQPRRLGTGRGSRRELPPDWYFATTVMELDMRCVPCQADHPPSLCHCHFWREASMLVA